jgi:hypothetical protein
MTTTPFRVGTAALACVAAALLAGCGSMLPAQPSGGNVKSNASASGVEVGTRFRLASDGLPITGRWKSVPALADLNGDGRVDLAVHPRLAKGARVFLADGRGAWRETSEGLVTDNSCGGGIRVGDVNRDGKPDLVVADHCQGIYVYLGDGQGGRWRAVAEPLNPEFHKSPRAQELFPGGYRGTEVVALGDLNADGMLDIVASSTDQGGLTAWLGDGTGTGWREVRSSGLPNGEESPASDAYWGGFAFDLQLVDVNRDGRLDVVASYYTGPRVWLGDGSGRFRDASKGLVETAIGGIYRRMAVADVNGDGRPDIVVANYVNGAELYLQNADGTWQGPIDAMPELGGGAQAVAIGDLDGDGHVDLVVGGALKSVVESSLERLPHGLFVRWGDGTGKFTGGRQTNLPVDGLEVIWGLQVMDVDGDGRADIVVSTGGETGRVPAGRPTVGPTATHIKQQPMTLPRVQVWLNEGPASR